jgi:hypothetical protein
MPNRLVSIVALMYTRFINVDVKITYITTFEMVENNISVLTHYT